MSLAVMAESIFMKRYQKNNNGFSLIELSVVLVIIGFLVVAALQAYRIYDEKSKIERMNILMATVDQTLQKFYEAEGRFPCPAAVNGSAAGNDYDAEECGGRFGVLNVAGTGTGRVLIGKVPAATLGLSSDYMRDIYGSYLTYAVTQAATVDGGSVQGEIRVREENIDRAAGSSTFGQIVELENHTNITYLIVSAGSSRVGAFNHDGAQIVACSGSSKDRENCNGDGVFISSLLSHASNGNGADFYDDRVAFKKDDDISDSVKTLKLAREGRDYDVVGGSTYKMRRDGYLQATLNKRSTMVKVSEGDIVTHNPRGWGASNPDGDIYSINAQSARICKNSVCAARNTPSRWGTTETGEPSISDEFNFITNAYGTTDDGLYSSITVGVRDGQSRGEWDPAGYSYAETNGYLWVEN